MIYLASPYSHSDPAVREQRFDAACATAAVLMRAGHIVFSPVIHGHPLTRLGLPGDWLFWESQARWQLERCEEVVVLMLDGWDESDGVRAEVEIATELGKVVWFRYPVRPTTPTLAHGAEGGDRW
jgi:Domain of unknown function (DUF1937)